MQTRRIALKSGQVSHSLHTHTHRHTHNTQLMALLGCVYITNVAWISATLRLDMTHNSAVNIHIYTDRRTDRQTHAHTHITVYVYCWNQPPFYSSREHAHTHTHTLALLTSMHSPLCASGLVHTQYKSPWLHHMPRYRMNWRLSEEECIPMYIVHACGVYWTESLLRLV